MDFCLCVVGFVQLLYVCGLWYVVVEIWQVCEIGGNGWYIVFVQQCGVCDEILVVFCEYVQCEIVVFEWWWVYVDCDVDFFVDYVDVLVGCFQVDFDVWVCGYECGDYCVDQ